MEGWPGGNLGDAGRPGPAADTWTTQHTRTLRWRGSSTKGDSSLAQGCCYRAAPMASATNVAPAAASAAARLSDAETSAWERLLESGFPRDASLCALACCEWRTDSALDWLLMKDDYRAAVLPPPAAGAPGEPSPESEPPGVPLSNAPAASQVQADVPRTSSSQGRGHVGPHFCANRCGHSPMLRSEYCCHSCTSEAGPHTEYCQRKYIKWQMELKRLSEASPDGRP